NYVFYQGTSMAAPHVAGVAALLYDLDPNISPATVSTVLQNTAKPFPTVTTRQCSTTNCGAGIVDAGAATAAITPPSSQSASIPWIKILLKN
ncbi:MAG: S8 family serine peptidase, partial [Pseudomonadota bacterium]